MFVGIHFQDSCQCLVLQNQHDKKRVRTVVIIAIFTLIAEIVSYSIELILLK